KRTTLQTMIALALGLTGATAVQAGPLVTDWNYTVTTEWGTPTFSAGGGEQFADEHRISWGDEKGGLDDWATLQPTNGGGEPLEARSGLEITPTAAVTSPPAPTLVTNGGAVNTHTITHYNYTISDTFAALTAASVITTLTLTP